MTDKRAEFQDKVAPLMRPLFAEAYRRMWNNPHKAQDLVADALATAWASYQFRDEVENFRGWIFTVLKFQFLTTLKNIKRNPADVQLSTLSEPVIEHWESASGSTAPASDWKLGVDEVDPYLIESINMLGPRQRETFVLRALYDRTNPEIAKIMGISVKSVEANMAHARTKIPDNYLKARAA